MGKKARNSKFRKQASFDQHENTKFIQPATQKSAKSDVVSLTKAKNTDPFPRQVVPSTSQLCVDEKNSSDFTSFNLNGSVEQANIDVAKNSSDRHETVSTIEECQSHVPKYFIRDEINGRHEEINSHSLSISNAGGTNNVLISDDADQNKHEKQSKCAASFSSIQTEECSQEHEKIEKKEHLPSTVSKCPFPSCDDEPNVFTLKTVLVFALAGSSSVAIMRLISKSVFTNRKITVSLFRGHLRERLILFPLQILIYTFVLNIFARLLDEKHLSTRMRKRLNLIAALQRLLRRLNILPPA